MLQFIRASKRLLPSLLFSFILIVFRVAWSATPTYLFLLWNLLLAAIPLFFSSLAANAGRFAARCYALLWLLFFPNSMYIITDLVHLKPRQAIPFWYDILLLISVATNGVLMGMRSLYNMEQWLRTFIHGKYLHTILFMLLLACGYGIYLGRYQRRNSWDVITHPRGLCNNVVHDFLHPIRNLTPWAITITFGVWLYVIYRNIRFLHITE